VITKAGVARIVPKLEATLREGGNHRDLRQELLRALGAQIGFDGGCGATLDPVTAMWTDCEVFEAKRDPAFEAQLFEAEYHHADVAPMTELAERAIPAAVLSVETAGDLERSVRYRNAFRPAGIGDELRLVLVESGVPWGSVQLVRSRGATPFATAEAEALAVLSAPLARLLRRALLLEACREPDERGESVPGVFVMRGARVLEASDSALSILGTSLAERLPAAIHGLVLQAKAGKSARASLPGPEGGWAVLHSTPIGDRVAIIVERARPLALAEVVSRALGLSPRERHIVAYVVRGRSTKQIASALSISDWTVQDHLKSIFGKVGVSSRQELVAALFFGYWAPEHERRSLPSPCGHYVARRGSR
jgi:DNA-binding CsgD family transcriptional regulator